MDKLDYYRQYVQEILAKHGKAKLQNHDVESELIFDTVRDYYQWMRVGWNGLHRV